MSSISFALATWLSNHAHADIPDRVYKNHAPQGTRGDHIIVTRLDEDPLNGLAGASSSLRMADFDIDCKSPDSEKAETIMQAVIEVLEPLRGPLNADWQCEAVILNNTTDAYLPPPGDGQDVTHYLASADITLQFQPV